MIMRSEIRMSFHNSAEKVSKYKRECRFKDFRNALIRDRKLQDPQEFIRLIVLLVIYHKSQETQLPAWLQIIEDLHSSQTRAITTLKWENQQLPLLRHASKLEIQAALSIQTSTVMKDIVAFALRVPLYLKLYCRRSCRTISVTPEAHSQELNLIFSRILIMAVHLVRGLNHASTCWILKILLEWARWRNFPSWWSPSRMEALAKSLTEKPPVQ